MISTLMALQGLLLLSGISSLLFCPPLLAVARNSGNPEFLMGDKLYLETMAGDQLALHIGEDQYNISIVENLLDLNTYNLMYEDKIVGAITKNLRVSGKLHLGEFTDWRLQTCHLYQLPRFPDYFLLKDGSTGQDLSIDERPFLTTNEV